jgi:ribosome maturation factor RimP
VDEEVVMPGGQRHAPKGGQPKASQPEASQSKPGQSRASQSKPGPSKAGQYRPRPAEAAGSVDESKLADVIGPVIVEAGMDLESFRVSAAGRRRLLRVVVDSDQGVSLDDAAAISRQLSAALDSTPVMGDFPYTLEVSSPGVDRPLTDPRHWRRTVGRLVKVAAGEAGTVTGRVVAADSDEVTLDVGGDRRRFGYAALGAGAVQVEFGHPQTELGATSDGH